jgi:hypothetical protein
MLLSHSTSPHRRASRSTWRGPASSRFHALIRSRAGSAAPKFPTSMTPARCPLATSTLPGVRSPWLITSGAARGSSLNAAHILDRRWTSSSPSLSLKQVLIHASWSLRSPPRPWPLNARPRVPTALTPAMNSARSAAKGTEPEGSSSSPVRPGSQDWTDHGSGYAGPGSPTATSSGTGNRVEAASSLAAAASDSSARRTAAGSVPCKGNRAASRSPMRKMALTVPGEATRLTGRSRHRGNCAPTRSRTTAAEIGSSPACMDMTASFPAAGG